MPSRPKCCYRHAVCALQAVGACLLATAESSLSQMLRAYYAAKLAELSAAWLAAVEGVESEDEARASDEENLSPFEEGKADKGHAAHDFIMILACHQIIVEERLSAPFTPSSAVPSAGASAPHIASVGATRCSNLCCCCTTTYRICSGCALQQPGFFLYYKVIFDSFIRCSLCVVLWLQPRALA